MSDYKLCVNLPVTDQFLYDVLTTAAEGGIHYWADYETDRDKDLNVHVIQEIRDTEEVWDWNEGGRNPEDAPELLERGYVNEANLLIGIQAALDGQTNAHSGWVERLLKAVSTEDGICELDADDCDVLVQIALFGEIVYG